MPLRDAPTGQEPSGAGRYAPSPTSALHVGNLRTAVLSWLFARTSGRALRLRIEDLDTDRVRAAAGVEQTQLADLDALGVTFDGPLVRQSERLDGYAAALDSLGEEVYECFCTRREIAEAASAPHGAAPGAYPGTCRDLTDAQREVRRQQRPAALRVRAEGARMQVHDLLHGEVEGIVDDFVLRRGDGVWAYNFAVVVDDLAMGIDQIVRGDDLLDSAPRQAWLAERLGGSAAAYAHVPLVLDLAGRRLAKRDGAVSLSDLAARGHDAGEVLGWIARSLGLAAPGEQVALEDLVARFDPARVSTEPVIFTGL